LRPALLAALLFAAPLDVPRNPPAQRFEYSRPLMGTSMRIVLYAADADTADVAADAGFARIVELDLALSDYDDASELMQLSRKAGRGPVKVSDDLFRVLRAAQHLFQRSDGAFDVTVGPLTVLWRRARRLAEMPDPARVAGARDLIGGGHMTLDERQRTATLVKPGMQLDVGGIAKGFAADEATAVLARYGMTSTLVAAGGDIRVTNPPPGADAWRIAIAPLEAADVSHATHVMLRNAAISTSGDAEQFVVIDGIRYSHIVDPRTGHPITRRGSVTVVAPDATTTDGLATAVAVLGHEKGLRLVDDSPPSAAMIVEADDAGVHSYESSRWRALRISP
jgi:FAD:protein FMN transferase